MGKSQCIIRSDLEVGDPLGQWGEVPVGWEKAVLWDLAEYVNGRAFKPTDFSPTGLPVIKITELKFGISDETSQYAGEYDQKHLLKKGDLLFSWSGNPETSLDVFWWHNGTALLNQHIFRVLPRDGVDKQYLYYLLRFLRPTFIGTARDKATSMGHVKVSDLKRLVAFLPPIAAQIGIGQFLRALDDKIELNRKINETLEAIARAIFKSWFVDFDPVRSKAEGCQPYGMDTSMAALFPDSFEDSSFGQIPKGWSLSSLGKVVGINERVIPNDSPHKFIEYVEISSVAAGKLLETTRVSLTDAPSRAKRLVAHGDTIWSCVRPNRKSYLFVHKPAPNLVVSTGFVVLTTKSIPPSYLYQWVTTDEFVEYLSYSADGSAYPAVRPERFACSEVLLPRQEVLQAFERSVGPMRDRIAGNEDESRTLVALRDLLLSKLISGEIRVRDAERFIEALR